MLAKILHYTKKFLFKNPFFFVFLANFIFVVSHLKIKPAVHLNTSKVLILKLFHLNCNIFTISRNIKCVYLYIIIKKITV